MLFHVKRAGQIAGYQGQGAKDWRIVKLLYLFWIPYLLNGSAILGNAGGEGFELYK